MIFGLAFWRTLPANPVLLRFTRRSGWPSLRGAVLLAIGIGAVSLVVGLSALRQQDPSLGWLPVLVLLAALFSPMAVAPLTAILVTRDTSGEAFQLLLLTDVSGRTLVEGYVFAALYRLRVWLAVMAGLSAVLATPLALRLSYTPPGLSPVLVVLSLPVLLMLLLGLLGMNLVAAALGTDLALYWRHRPALAVVLAVLFMPFLIFWAWLVAGVMGWPTYVCGGWGGLALREGDSLVREGVAVLNLYWLAFAFMLSPLWVARHWLRRAERDVRRHVSET